MDEKIQEIKEIYRNSYPWQYVDHIKYLLSHISTLEAQLTDYKRMHKDLIQWQIDATHKLVEKEARVKEYGDKINDYEHQLIEAGMEVSCLRNRVQELEAERR